jgi:hypothetical protein
MQNQDITKFEFILTLENNIIIQRFFNVKGYNPQVKKSLDLYQSVKEICEEISYDLKMKSMEFMYENQEFFLDPEVVETETDIKEEHFLLRIKLEDAVFISRIFPAHVYHPKARYSVDIRPKVRPFLADLTYVLSSDKLETTYSGIRL